MIVASRQRSFVMLSVLIIVMLALLTVTSILFLTQAETAARQRSGAAAQARSLAWSAAQVVMHELDAQRDVILQGRCPTVEDQYTLFEIDGRLGVVRLLPVGQADQLLQPQAALLDINEIDAETLAATNVVDIATAQRIVQHRDRHDGGQFTSVAEIATAEGLEPRVVFGGAQRFDFMHAAQQPRDASAGSRSAGSDDAPPQAIVDVVTVFGFEPAIQRSGARRINLDVPWSDELGQRVNERFGDGAAQVLRRIVEQTSFDEESVIYDVLIALNVEAQDWPDIVDALTTESGMLHFGRVDLNTASAAVLAALPGIEPEQAAQIVQMRDTIDDEERATVVWPLLHGILPREAYPDLADHLTTRSWTYRARLAVGVVDSDAPDGPLDSPMIYDVIVDLSALQPRIASWRDVTMFQSAVALAHQVAVEHAERAQPADDLPSEAMDDDVPAATPAGDVRSNSSRPPESSPGSRPGPPDAAPSADPASRRRPGRWHSGD